MYATTEITVCPFSNKHSAALMSPDIVTNGFRVKHSNALRLLELDRHARVAKRQPLTKSLPINIEQPRGMMLHIDNLYTKFIEEYLSLDHKHLKLKWHEKLPVLIAAVWAFFVQSLPALEKLKIPRFVLSENLESIILYGFSDASEKGFGDVTYVSVIKNNGDRHSQLLCSKSRVSPLKTLTIPRLELPACLLLSMLVRKVINSLKMNLSQVILLSDSTIALSWIKTPPHLLKTFVANRVPKIQELTVNFSWYHISSENNPADLVSRFNVSDLINSPLWRKGPGPSIFTNDELLENIND
ncbi:uncharacterized protein TNCV_61521 [Trichonephila clavipes]|nr:uncharacterized protein TNCV_61521 [Trichonephila clavipes]